MKLEPQLGIAEADRIGTGTAIGLDAGDNYDDPQRAQKLLYSRAEFLAEDPVKQPIKNGKLKPDTLSVLELALTLDRNEKTRLSAHGADLHCGKTATNLMGRASPANMSPLVVFSACESTFWNQRTQCSGLFGIAQTRQDPYRGPPKSHYEVEIGHFKM